MLPAILIGCLAVLGALPAAPGDRAENHDEARAVGAPDASQRRLWVVPRGLDAGLRVAILGYLYPDSWLVEAAADALAGFGAVPFEDARKTAPALNRLAKSHPPETSVALEIVLHPSADPGHVSATLAKLAPELAVEGHRPGPPGRLIASVPGTRLGAAVTLLQRRSDVLWLDRYRPLRWLNAHTIEPIQANADSGGALPSITPIWDQGLVGTGQIVGIADSGLDRNEAWFSRYHDGTTLNAQITDAADTAPPAVGPLFPNRKVIAYWVMPGASPYDDDEICSIASTFFHGTHVTGTAAGDRGTASRPGNARYETGDGMAPHAQILFQDLGNDQSGCLAGQGGAPMWAQSRAGGARIHSNSYGASPAGGYTASDAEVDEFLWQHEDMLIVFAAGNEGGSMTINHPGNAKHVLTVGALNHGSSTVPANFSSRGPASDGRLKPDLMAPGVSIISASGNDNDTSIGVPATKPFSGTSMAAPAVAGAAAMARQYFVDGFYPSGMPLATDRHLPSGVLLKAVLLNGTRTYSDTPAADTGWGRVWLDNNLYFAGDPRALRIWSLPNDAGLADAESHAYSIQVDAGEEFRATLVWYDPPPSPASMAALVNDLDLVVTTPSMATLRGNVFSAGESVAGGPADTLNPVEQVRLEEPVAGSYTVRVDASAVIGNGQPGSDRQGYALVVSAADCPTAVGAAPDFTLTPDPSGVLIDVMTVLPGADRYQYYRALGTCAVDPASLQFAGAGPGPGLLDQATQGGFRYAYRVRGADACGEGPISVCREVVSQAPCTLTPDFDPAPALAAPLGSFCAVELSWTAAAARCPGAAGVEYEVHRSTDPFFDPGLATEIATGLTGSRFTDYQAPPGVTHYYRVVAVDDLGNSAPPTAPVPYAAVGSETMPGTYFDGGEALALATLEAPWRLTEQDADSGARSYRTGLDGIGYPPNACAALTTRPIPLQAGAGLSYAARYELESGWDGVVVEISANGGLNWMDLAPDGAYPDGFTLTGVPPANACGYPVSQGAFSGTAGAFATFTSDLSAWAGQTVLIRWRFSSDPGVELDGFYLDDIAVSNAGAPLACLANELLFADGYE